MKQTKYELIGLRNTDQGINYFMNCRFPMNTPLMLVRTHGNRLGLKRLRKPRRATLIGQIDDNQLRLV